jgi:hypothetical protein
MPMETNTKNPDAESSNAKKCPLFFKQKFLKITKFKTSFLIGH